MAWFRAPREHSLAARGHKIKTNQKTVLRAPALRGGMSEGRSPRYYDNKELRKGIEVEMEHTDDPEIAMQIAMDHLEEHPEYYKYLPKMEKKLYKRELKHQKRERKRLDKKRGKKVK